ncbi:MmcQ/YjbR family DNA-binding protein [Angustibacter aerolatus]
MAHPRMFTDDDPHLDVVRRVCLALPEAAEVEAWGRPTFRAGSRGKIFAVFSGVDEHPWSLILRADPDERPALLQDPRCFLAPHYRTAPWLSLDLDAAPLDETELRELVETSYRSVALQRQLRQLG